MTPLSHLEDMLSEFRPLFKHNNFNHFQTFVKGLISTASGHDDANLSINGTLNDLLVSTEVSLSGCLVCGSSDIVSKMSSADGLSHGCLRL